MPTIFERIDTALEGNELSVQLNVQVDGLNGITTQVTSLINNPPEGIGNLQASLEGTSLPNLEVSVDFATTMNSLKEAIPTDLSSVNWELVARLQQIQTDITIDLVRPLNRGLNALTTIYNLTQIDLLCENPGSNGNGSNGAEGVESATNGSGNGSTPSEETAATTASPAATLISQTNDSLDLLPLPLSAETFLPWLHQGLNNLGLDFFGLVRVPVLDDLRDPLDTLMTWKAMGSAELAGHIATSLQDLNVFIGNTINGILSSIESDLSEITTQLPGNELAQIADDLLARLVQLGTAVDSGDISGTGPIVTEMNGLLDQYDVLRGDMQTEMFGRLDSLKGRLSTLHEDLEDQMGRIVAVLEPNSPLEFISLFSPFLHQGITDSEAVPELEKGLKRIVDWLQELIEAIDLTAIQEPIISAADSVHTAIDKVDDALVNVTLEVKALFAEVEVILDSIDPEAVATEVTEAIEEFKTELVQELTNLFAPASEAVSDVITTIDGTVNQFDPATIINALREAIQTLTGVLEDPEVVAAIKNIRDTLDKATKQLETLSFSPLTNEVIAAIEEVAETLRGIDTSDLSPALQMALQAAVAVLPKDLSPVIDPLITQFGELVEGGPVPLVKAVQKKPQQLLDSVRQFEPAMLVGDTLSKPFQALVSQIEAFAPGQLLEPIEQEVERLKTRLKDNARPGLVIEPLEPLFDELLEAIDRLQPSSLITPLEETINTVINNILDSLPVKEAFEQVDKGLLKVREVIDISDGANALLQKVSHILQGFGAVQMQLGNFIESILNNVDSIANTGPLQQLLDELSLSLNNTRSSQLSNRLDAAMDPLLDTLNTLDPQARLTSLVQGHRRISGQALAALPSSSEKTALTAVLGRSDPLQVDFSKPYQLLAELRVEATQTTDNLQETLTDWDVHFHGDGSVLAELDQLQATPQQLRQWVRQALETQLVNPLSALLGMAGPLNQSLSPFLNELQRLATELEAKVASLTQGLDSLSEISDKIQELIQKLQDFDLSFLSESLDSVFASLRTKLEVVDPAQLRETVDGAFHDIVDTLDVSLFIAPAEVEQLDANYKEVIAKLKTLDPEALVTQIVQPEFENTAIPILNNFDVTDLLNVLVDRLNTLDDELKEEMDRVNKAYQAMLQAAPSLSISIDVDIEVPF